MSKVYPVGYQDLTPVEENNNEEENDKEQAEGSYNRRHKTEPDQISIITIEEDPASTVLEEKRNERIFSVKSLKKEEQTASAIQLEKIKHEWKLNVRNQTFTKILVNESLQINWPRFCLQILATILLTASISSFITVIPFHNTVLYPEYWYESMIQLIPNSISWAVFYALMDAYFLNCIFIKEIRYVLKMCLASNILMQNHYAKGHPLLYIVLLLDTVYGLELAHILCWILSTVPSNVLISWNGLVSMLLGVAPKSCI